jgi:hypothetical protein
VALCKLESAYLRGFGNTEGALSGAVQTRKWLHEGLGKRTGASQRYHGIPKYRGSVKRGRRRPPAARP